MSEQIYRTTSSTPPPSTSSPETESTKAIIRRTADVEKGREDICTILVRDKSGLLRSVELQRRELIRRAAGVTVARQVLNFVENYHVNEVGRRIKLDAQWRQIYADPSTDMRIIAPSQRGKTLYQIVKTMAQLSLGMSVGWVMPKDGKVQELVRGKINPTIKNTPLYASMQNVSDGNDTIHFKTFGRYGKLYVVTANSTDELTSFTADAMHVDERDFCNRVNLPMYTSRMNYSPYKLADEISTPTFEGNKHTRLAQVGNDNIHSEFLHGDQYRYHSQCPHCGEVQILDWYDNIVEVQQDESGRIQAFNWRDKEWEGPDSARDLRVVCRKCLRPFDRTLPGRWISLNPNAKMRTYWVEALASPIGDSMAKLMRRFELALGNPSKMQHFHNMDLGRTFAGGMMRFGMDLFERCVDPQHHMQLQSDGPCTIGIDVNRPWLDIHISRWVHGKQVKVAVFKEQGDESLIMRLIERYKIGGGVIDNGPETKFSLKVQEKALENFGIHIVRCKYATNEQAREIVVSEAGENAELDPPRLITVNRTVAIDSLFESMQLKDVVWFAEWQEAASGSVLDEFSNPVRKLEVNDAGNTRFVWDGKPDDQLHAAVYDLIAGEILDMKIVRDYSDIGAFVNRIQHGGGIGFTSLPTPTRDNSVMILRG